MGKSIFDSDVVTKEKRERIEAEKKKRERGGSEDLSAKINKIHTIVTDSHPNGVSKGQLSIRSGIGHPTILKLHPIILELCKDIIYNNQEKKYFLINNNHSLSLSEKDNSEEKRENYDEYLGILS
tara:strand:- start:1059 stop:1433 length:375 start_codon:yes stop_codon:yes gene_type:complete